MSEHEEFKSWITAFNKKHEQKDRDNSVTEFNSLKSYHEENQYLNLIKEIIDDGFFEKGRNGTTLSVFGRSMRFSLKNGKIPLLTTKNISLENMCKRIVVVYSW